MTTMKTLTVRMTKMRMLTAMVTNMKMLKVRMTKMTPIPHLAIPAGVSSSLFSLTTSAQLRDIWRQASSSIVGVGTMGSEECALGRPKVSRKPPE